MDFNIKIDKNKYMEQFFCKFKSFELEIKDNFYNTLPAIINLRPHKIKTAYHLKRNGYSIYEYKVVLNDTNFRAAYVIIDNNIELFFISSTTIKREFVKLLESTDLVD